MTHELKTKMCKQILTVLNQAGQKAVIPRILVITVMNMLHVMFLVWILLGTSK